MAALHAVVLVIALIAVGSTFDYKPVFYPGPCPNVPPSANFSEHKLYDFWYGTHFTNPSFDGYQCMTNNLTKHSFGLQFNVRLQNASGHDEIFKCQVNSTQTPGVFKTTYETTGKNGSVVHGLQVFYFLENENKTESDEKHCHLLAWNCVEDPERNRHAECASILSRNNTTPNSAVDHIKHYLKSHGSPVLNFSMVENKNC